MIKSRLYEKVNYTQDLGLLKSCNIFEYDIEKANINILYHRGLIKEDLYEFLKKQPNIVRKVMVGKMERLNKNLTKEKALGIIEAKKMFFDKYSLEDKDILSVRNDALFVLRKLEPVTAFDNIRFTLRNEYNMFLRVHRVQFYYYFDMRSGKEVLHAKGIRDEIMEEQKDYMIDFLKEVFHTFTIEGVTETLNLIRNFYINYTHGNYPVGYYRDLFTGLYNLNTESKVFQFKAIAPSDEIVPLIDISNNGAFLRELAKVFYTEYLRSKTRMT
jgi:hypothetical protein